MIRLSPYLILLCICLCCRGRSVFAEIVVSDPTIDLVADFFEDIENIRSYGDFYYEFGTFNSTISDTLSDGQAVFDVGWNLTLPSELEFAHSVRLTSSNVAMVTFTVVTAVITADESFAVAMTEIDIDGALVQRISDSQEFSFDPSGRVELGPGQYRLIVDGQMGGRSNNVQDNFGSSAHFAITAVPEPTSLGFACLFTAGLTCFRRRKL